MATPRFNPGDQVYLFGQKPVKIKKVEGYACILDNGMVVSAYDLATELNGMYGYVYEDEACKLMYHIIERGCATHVYLVKLLEGEWPSDEDLISICDSKSKGYFRSTFGGRVEKYEMPQGRYAKVDVYVD